MPHSGQAKKRARQNVKRAERNQPYRTRAARRVRDARDALVDGDATAAADLVRGAQAALDRAARRGIIHPNAAARRKSRLAAQLKALQTSGS